MTGWNFPKKIQETFNSISNDFHSQINTQKKKSKNSIHLVYFFEKIFFLNSNQMDTLRLLKIYEFSLFQASNVDCFQLSVVNSLSFFNAIHLH